MTKTKMTRVTIDGPFYGSAQPARLTINGRSVELPINRAVEIDDEQLSALENSDHQYRVHTAETAAIDTPAGEGAVPVPNADGDTANPATADTPSDQTHLVSDDSDDDVDNGPGSTATKGNDGSKPPKLAGQGESAVGEPAPSKPAAAKDPLSAAKKAPAKAAAKPRAKKSA